MPPDAPADLSPTARLILTAIRAAEANPAAYRPLDTTRLRALSGTPHVSFFRAIKQLEARGLILIVRTPGLPNVYASTAVHVHIGMA